MRAKRNPGPGGGGPGQTSMASGQRGANGQPGGSAASEGGAPRDRHPPRGAFRHVADRWPLRCAPRRQLGSNVHGTNPVGQVCLLLHVSSVDEGHADGPAANLQGPRDPPHADCRVLPSAMPMSAQDNPWSRTSRTRSRSPASIFVADVDGIRSSSSSPHIKAHFGSDGGSAGTAWPTCRRCRCLPGDERGNPHLGENTDFKDDRVGRSPAISDASAKQSSNANSICGNASRTQRRPTLALLP